MLLPDQHCEVRATRTRALPADLPEQACALAAKLFRTALADRSSLEASESVKMQRLLADQEGKEFTFHLADEVFRPPTARRQAAIFRRLLTKHGVPSYLTVGQRFLMRLAGVASRMIPAVVMPAVTRQIKKDSKRVILPREEHRFHRYLERRLSGGNKVNLNLLGEAVLGEDEARHRLEENLLLLREPTCTCLSVKISAIYSQINLLDQEGSIAAIQERLRLLYRAALAPSPQAPKFITLDMEEYRDLELTCLAFQRTLDEPEFLPLEAGIVLQAYLPDSFPVLQELTTWAIARKARGGAGIKVRLVKGANLAMEQVEASLHQWEQAPYECKLDVDANFKRMLHFACQPKHAAAVRIGLASHNLFDIAYALLLRAHHGVEDRVELEMLEGMANEQARILSKEHSPVLFYAPVVRRDNFHSAIAYLVRRLDENTSPENFLSNLFSMTPGDALWQEQESSFRKACARMNQLSSAPRRTQDRGRAVVSDSSARPFANCLDTDWVLPANRSWLHKVLAQFELPQEPLPLQIAGKFLHHSPITTVSNPSAPTEKYQHHLATPSDVAHALAAATASSWSSVPAPERAALLTRVASELECSRGKLIATMRADAAKAVPECDVEISEAIDFANYYRELIAAPGFQDGTSPSPLGPVVVTPPWNFPCAIPCGGLLAALAAGNPVLLKPAPETVLTAWEMIQCLWRAGIPKDACQFLPCPDNEVGQALVSDHRLGAVILTGASSTAQRFRSWNPTRPLFAETSGKNALIITAAADPDLAIKDLVRSAFGHAGQKCSAASLALVEASLLDHPAFLKQLRDAAASLPVGPSHDPAAIVTPLIREPGPELRRGLTQLDPGESWLLKPREITPTLWSPGIRLGVKVHSWIHRTELFGPVLALIRVDNLEEAIHIQNASEFALTGGLHSLDPDEISKWRESVEVGNAYLNRPLTGAIVRRQPFGGWKGSSVGPGAKAGGPNYLAQFSHWHEHTLPSRGCDPTPEVQECLDRLIALLPEARERLSAAARSYAYWWREEFSGEHDPSQLRGEDNHFRYRPAPRTVFRASPESRPLDLALVLLATKTVGGLLEVSADGPTRCHELCQTLSLPLVTESTEVLCAGLKKTPLAVLRAPHPEPALHQAPLHLHHHEPLANGRLELLCYLHEQAISQTTHRHGRLAQS